MAIRTPDDELRAVASIAGRHKKMRFRAEADVGEMNRLFVRMCVEFKPDRLFDLTETMWVWKYLPSSAFGVTSVVKDYTNKKGVTFKAHFTHNGKFLRKASDDGRGIVYNGNFRVMKGAFDLDNAFADELYEKCEDKTYKVTSSDISKLFKVKDEDDMPLEFWSNTGKYGTPPGTEDDDITEDDLLDDDE